MGVAKVDASVPPSREEPQREVKPFDPETLSYEERYQVGGLFASLVDVTGGGVGQVVENI